MVAIETILTRDEVLKILTENEVSRLIFYKVNGEIRDMVATLNRDELAKLALEGYENASVPESDLEYDENQIRVYDVEKKGWRSFLLSNLISIEGSNL